ncbi:hypothetical protein [Arcanobacterium phocae]|uniref:hypothetical protein n=1 Tax=Arcanobacterium phocae TaxID=131112 RepID=UPI001C10D9B0|nr:hypothetical protein [Arcanobacterium phocae]
MRTNHTLGSWVVAFVFVVGNICGLPSLASATSEPSSPSAPSELTEEEQEWFTTIGSDLMRAKASETFGEDIGADPELLSLGTAHHAFAFSQEKELVRKPETAFVESNMWLAPVYKDADAVGALITEGNGAARRANTRIVADPRLATEAAAWPNDTTSILVYDPQLKAWFVFRDGMIEPGDSVGSGYVLGSIAFDMFMEHRKDLIDTDVPATAIPAKSLTPSTENKQMTPAKIIIVFAILSDLAIFSVAWLRWDQNRKQLGFSKGSEPAIEQVHTPSKNRWDPFAKARLLIHPQKQSADNTIFTKDIK